MRIYNTQGGTHKHTGTSPEETMQRDVTILKIQCREVPILKIYNTHGGNHIENTTHREVTGQYNREVTEEKRSP